MPSAEDLTQQIKAELRKVLESFGVHFMEPSESDPPGENVIKLDLKDAGQVCRILEARGADVPLLCAIGSWGDTLTDAEVLEQLRAWNREGADALRSKPSFASVDQPDAEES